MPLHLSWRGRPRVCRQNRVAHIINLQFWMVLRPISSEIGFGLLYLAWVYHIIESWNRKSTRHIKFKKGLHKQKKGGIH